MNALAHYCSILAKTASMQTDEQEDLRSEAIGLYERLQVVDEDRKERYRDMGKLVLGLYLERVQANW